MSFTLHDPDCPMTNSDEESRTVCICDDAMHADADGSHRTVPVGGINVRCEDCQHPMSEGTWEGDTSDNKLMARRMEFAGKRLRLGEEPVGDPIHFSRCDEKCEHGGAGRWRSSMSLSPGWMERPDASMPVSQVEMTLKECDELQASWRPVDVRRLSWPHDLRPENLAVLCLRCFVAR